MDRATLPVFLPAIDTADPVESVAHARRPPAAWPRSVSPDRPRLDRLALDLAARLFEMEDEAVEGAIRGSLSDLGCRFGGEAASVAVLSTFVRLARERGQDLKHAKSALEKTLGDRQRRPEAGPADVGGGPAVEVARTPLAASIVGSSPSLARVLAQVDQVAPTGAPVLVLGETGTGKDLVARALHERSPRCDRPFVILNCAALPAALVESELFGYEKGAFTGALQRTAGRFESAHGGSIFLDEIGELPPEAQAKLLRVAQTGEFERLGSPRTIRVDVRMIAATNRDLERDLAAGRFRADLFYRLNVFPIALPSLRERAEDIPLLVWHFITRRQVKHGRSVRAVPERLMRAFVDYPWPGNVRELENVIERALILTSGPTLAFDPAFLQAAPAAVAAGPGPAASLRDAERAHIRAVLEACGWKVSGRGNAADRLGLKRSTLQFRMKKLGIARPADDAAPELVNGPWATRLGSAIV